MRAQDKLRGVEDPDLLPGPVVEPTTAQEQEEVHEQAERRNASQDPAQAGRNPPKPTRTIRPNLSNEVPLLLLLQLRAGPLIRSTLLRKVRSRRIIRVRLWG